MRRLAALTLLIASPAFAQDAREIDVDEIEYCLGEAGYTGPADPHECVGFVTDACQQDPETGGPGSAADCTLREAASWMQLAGKRMDKLRSGLKPEILAEAEAAQSAWVAYRDAHCGATGAFFYQYSGSASAEWQAACLRDLAADRAILLDDWAMRTEDFR